MTKFNPMLCLAIILLSLNACQKAELEETFSNEPPVEMIASEDEIASSISTTKANTFTLINADSDKDISVIENGATINLANLSSKKINVRANITTVKGGSLVWNLSGTETKKAIEATAPFALFGNSGTNYYPWTPKLGSYTLTATAYSLSGGKGTRGTSVTIKFKVIDKKEAAPAPQPETVTEDAKAPVQDTKTPEPTAPVNTNLILYSPFESSGDLNNWSKEISRQDAVTISNTVSRKGNSSARFEFTKDDVIRYKGAKRAEVKLGVQKQSEGWFGMSVFLPSDFIKDPIPEIIAQWHAYPDLELGEQWISPPLALTIKNDRYFATMIYSSAKVTHSGNWTVKEFDLGPVEKNKWTDWAFRINWSYGKDGVLEVYKNKQKLISYAGPIGFNDKYYPYFKMGIYKWGWAGWASSSPASKRVLYIDEVKVGDRSANLNSVSPN